MIVGLDDEFLKWNLKLPVGFVIWQITIRTGFKAIQKVFKFTVESDGKLN